MSIGEYPSTWLTGAGQAGHGGQAGTGQAETGLSGTAATGGTGLAGTGLAGYRGWPAPGRARTCPGG